MSNYKGYNKKDNAKRKANNIETGDELEGTMSRVKKYGGSGPSAATEEARRMKALSKRNPVKVYTKEEIEELLTQRSA